MRTLRHGMLALVVIVLVLAAVTHVMAFRDEEEPLKRIMELREDISLLNLLNGLHLTNEQQAALLTEARNAQALKMQYRNQYSPLIPQAEKQFEELKAQLMNPDTPPQAVVEQSAQQTNEQIKKIRESFVSDLSEIEKRVNAILTDGQKKIVEDFSPCLIPPKDLKNPTRVGQANDSTHIERMLTRARTLSDDVFEERVEQILDRHISKYEERFGEFPSDGAREAEKTRVRAVVDEARAMSDVDFELNKQELATRIDPRARQNAQKRPARRFGHEPSKIARLLLNERIIPILEQKVARAGLPQKTGQTKLSSITPAEDCRVQCGKK
ncbi:MAG: hypothetical protein HY801_10120 [Candidatus Lindowbacteria bacterium]|nr:hypothetical protein [Candidatus Lindowbacteria bacterium]